jgi:peptide chain release factor 2
VSELSDKTSELEERLAELEAFFDVEGLREEAAELGEQMSRPGFWDDQERARELSARFSRVQGRIGLLEGLRGNLSDSEELLQLADEDGDLLSEVEKELRRVERVLEEQEVARLFTGEYDEGGAILTINSGAGGVDSQDWAEMLSRMYRRWAERRGFELEVIEYTEGEEAGIKSATFTVSGEYAFGLLSAERGVHRLVRISPFDASSRRHTSFASVAGHRRQGRGRDRREGPQDRHIPGLRGGWAARQQDRLGGAHNAPANRHRGAVPERAEPAPEP